MKPEFSKGPDALFYLWYGNGRMWDFFLGWVPGYPGSGAREEKIKRSSFKRGNRSMSDHMSDQLIQKEAKAGL